MYFGDDLHLHSWVNAQINLTVTDGNCIGNSIVVLGEDRGNNTIRFRTDSSLSLSVCDSDGVLQLQVSPNGYDWIMLSDTIQLIDTDPYSILFVYIAGIDDFGWTYAHNIGRMGVAEEFGQSIETIYLQSIDSYDPAELERLSAEYENEVDLMILTSIDTYSVLAVAANHPNLQYILIGDDSLSDIDTTVNTNFAWALFDQVQYLAGIIAGGMLRTEGRLCYIKGYDDKGVTTSMNAFVHGVHVLNPNASIYSWTIGTWEDKYIETQIASDFLDKYNCEMSAQHSDSINPQEIYVDRNLFAIGEV